MGVIALKPVLDGRGMSIAIVVGRTEADLARRMLRGAMARLQERGADRDPDVHWVATGFQVPLIVMQLAESSRYDGVLTLACLPDLTDVTAPQEPLANQLARGLMHVQLDTGVPVGLALLTATDREQALARTGDRENAGAAALDQLLETINLQRAMVAADEDATESENEVGSHPDAD